jgi:hypothetical protein
MLKPRLEGGRACLQMSADYAKPISIKLRQNPHRQGKEVATPLEKSG